MEQLLAFAADVFGVGAGSGVKEADEIFAVVTADQDGRRAGEGTGVPVVRLIFAHRAVHPA